MRQLHVQYLLWALLLIADAVAGARARAGSVELLVTADNEGHVGPCQTCPTHSGLGGLRRRASVVTKLRGEADKRVLLLDAGDALFGDDSFDSDGRVIVAAYGAIGYDVLNLSYRDFRLGKDSTLRTLEGARFTIVSANLLDARTKELLEKPFVVKEVGGHKIAVLGVTESPAGLEILPRLKRQLAGVAIRNPLEALAEWIPKARSASEGVVLLYYGGAGGFSQVRTRFGPDLAAICLGGLRPDDLPSDVKPDAVAAEKHGKSIATSQLFAEGVQPGSQVTQVLIEAAVPPDPAIAELLLHFQLKPVTVSRSPASMPSTNIPSVPTDLPTTNVSTAPLESAVSRPTTLASAVPMSTPPPAPPPASMPVAVAPPKVALRRVSAHSTLAPQGLAGVGLTADQVNAAIERGRDFLWTNLQAELVKEHRAFGKDNGLDSLEALALIHAGAQLKYPQFDAMVRDFLDRLDPVHDSLGTYPSGIACMLIGDYADPKYFPKMRLLARSLVEQQLVDGSWHYGRNLPESAFGDLKAGPPLSVEGGVPLGDPAAASVPAMTRVEPFEKHDPGDTSTTQFAMLGLRAAARVRVSIAPELWQRSLQSLAARICPDGGWAYNLGAISSYGSMTCAGICSVAVARHERGDSDAADDPLIEQGLGWLDAHFSVATNPGSGSYLYYYLYSLERVGRILDSEFIGTHEWYPQGARFLVGGQKPNGSWLEESDKDPRASTSFALLFLTRATQSLNVELKRGGEGRVTTSVATPPPARLYVILDASGSMLDEMDGRKKFDIARDSVATMLAGMPDTAEVALRVYGHRLRSNEKGSDEDTALEFPMGPMERPKLKSLLQRLRSRGKTPLALSLIQAKADLSSLSGQPVTVVLLTDGGEDTMPRRDPVKAAADFATLPGVTFHIVGFDINQEEWGRQLHQMAEASHGHYWPAARAKALERELRSAVFGIPDDFTLYDSSQAEVARGAFGDTRRLPEGKYLFKTQYAGQEFKTDVWVNTDSATGIIFDANKAMAGPKPTTAPSNAPAATPRRFCTHCGHTLPPGAKFCPSCGQPVKP